LKRAIQLVAGGFSLKAALLALVLALPMFALVEHIYRIELDRAEASLRSEILQQSAAMRARLEGELNATLFLVTGLTGYVAAYDDFLESERVQTALEVIHAQNPHLRNVALAPDNVIQHIHPVQGNEAAHRAELPGGSGPVACRCTCDGGPSDGPWRGHWSWFRAARAWSVELRFFSMVVAIGVC
jgi:hypothetical protein